MTSNVPVMRAIPQDDGDVDLAALRRIASEHRILITICCAIFGIAGLVYALVVKPVFRAEVTVADVRDLGGGSSALASSLGGLASLAGMNMGEGTTQDQSNQAVLDSRRLVTEFVVRNDLTPVLFPHPRKPPTLWKAVKTFKEGILSVRRDRNRGITIVGVEWIDPKIAARWANDVVALANELIRARALQDSTRNIDYLEREIEKTNDVELRRVIYTIIESETKTKMLANGRVEYAFQVIDPAVPPEIKVRPKRSLIVLGALALGAFV